MQPRQRAVLVLIGFFALAVGVVAAVGSLLLAEDKGLAAGVISAVLAVLVVAAQGAKWLWKHWVELPPGQVARLMTSTVVVTVVVALLGVGGRAVFDGGDGDGGGDRAGPPSGATTDLRPVTGVVGSEKRAFFDDPRVAEAFARHGLDVTTEVQGSGQMASADEDIAGFDFAFPASVPTAVGIQERYGLDTATSTPFSSPMVIVSFAPVADALVRAGIARQEDDGTWTFDVAGFVALAAGPPGGRTWGALGLEDYPPNRPVLVRTTDPWSSNSGAMYLAIVQSVGERLVAEGRIEAVAPVVAGLFDDQGISDPTTDNVFEAYLNRGIEFAPLVFAYEAEYVAHALDDGGAAGAGDDGRVLLYPSPTVLTKHTVVPFSAEGTEVGELLRDDPALQELAAAHGFRPAGARDGEFGDLVGDAGPGLRIDVAAADTIDPPPFEEMERLLADLAAAVPGT